MQQDADSASQILVDGGLMTYVYNSPRPATGGRSLCRVVKSPASIDPSIGDTSLSPFVALPLTFALIGMMRESRVDEVALYRHWSSAVSLLIGLHYPSFAADQPS